MLQRAATQQHADSITMSREPGVLAQHFVGTVAQHPAMSHACTKAKLSVLAQRNTPRTAFLLGSLSASSSALPPPVSPTCGGLALGATAQGVSRTGLPHASVLGVDLQMARYVFPPSSTFSSPFSFLTTRVAFELDVL